MADASDELLAVAKLTPLPAGQSIVSAYIILVDQHTLTS